MPRKASPAKKTAAKSATVSGSVTKAKSPRQKGQKQAKWMQKGTIAFSPKKTQAAPLTDVERSRRIEMEKRLGALNTTKKTF